MSSATPDLLASASAPAWRRWARHHGWTVGVWLLLIVLVAWYSALIPKFGMFQVCLLYTSDAADDSSVV